jgi:flagellar motility protein MotE (MotC chaperone)
MKFPRKKRILAPAGRGSILVIAAFLLSSATLRVVTSASGVFAKDSQLPTTPMATAHPAPTVEKAAEAGHDQRPSASAMIENKDEISSLIKALQERELRVSEREKQLEVRLRALSVADAEIEKRLVSLTETEEALRATLSLADEASEKDLVRLTTVYESMKPKDAALLFEQMEPNFSAGFLGRMRPDIAAEVMAGLSPQVAYSISVILAGRNASAPKS